MEEILRDGFAGLLKIENEINRIYENMATISDIEECNRMANRVSMLQQKFQDDGGYEIDTEINMVCSGLLIREEMRYQNYNSLSGEKKRWSIWQKVCLENRICFYWMSRPIILISKE